MESNKNNYIYYNYLDYMRLVSAFFVVLIHCSGILIANPMICSYTNIIIRSAVPIFVMISGACLLASNKHIPIKKLFTKHILKLIFVYFLWIFICNIVKYGFDFNKVFSAFSNSSNELWYHLWYLPMLVGLYLLTPIFKLVCQKENKKVVEYILLLFIIVNGILGFLNNINISTKINYFFDCFATFSNYTPINYIGYYIAGWYFTNFDLSKKQKILLYSFALVVFLISPLSSLINASGSQKWEIFTNNIGIFNIIISFSIFQLFKNSPICNKQNKIIQTLSKATFLSYLSHTAIKYLLDKLFLNNLQALTTTALQKFLFFIMSSTIIFTCSMLISLTFHLFIFAFKLFIQKFKNKKFKHSS